MKRYFNNMSEEQVVMIEFEQNSIIKNMDVCSLFGTINDIVEISKSEYRRQMYAYQRNNETNMTMTISR